MHAIVEKLGIFHPFKVYQKSDPKQREKHSCGNIQLFETT